MYDDTADLDAEMNHEYRPSLQGHGSIASYLSSGPSSYTSRVNPESVAAPVREVSAEDVQQWITGVDGLLRQRRPSGPRQNSVHPWI